LDFQREGENKSLYRSTKNGVREIRLGVKDALLDRYKGRPEQARSTTGEAHSVKSSSNGVSTRRGEGPSRTEVNERSVAYPKQQGGRGKKIDRS